MGYLIARNATVSGAEGGCQAEIGAAAAMAAAAAVEMAGGTPAQALDAAANALSSLMGLVCDPVGGLVEVPCQKRNATAAATALVSAQIALAGVGNLVGFDETVAAMDAVGRTLPFELRESASAAVRRRPERLRLVRRARLAGRPGEPSGRMRAARPPAFRAFCPDSRRPSEKRRANQRGAGPGEAYSGSLTRTWHGRSSPSGCSVFPLRQGL